MTNGQATPSEMRKRERHRCIGFIVFPVYLPHQAKAISLAMSLAIGYRTHFATISRANFAFAFAWVWLHHKVHYVQVMMKPPCQYRGIGCLTIVLATLEECMKVTTKTVKNIFILPFKGIYFWNAFSCRC